MNPLPKLTDSMWFSLDERHDDDALLALEEDEYKFMVQQIISGVQKVVEV